MVVRDYLNFDTEDFVLDEEFRKWVQHPDPESDRFWAAFIQEHPEKQKIIQEASLIIRLFQPDEPSVPAESLEQIREKVRHHQAASRKILLQYAKYAALFFLLVAVGGLVYLSLRKNSREKPFEIASTEAREKGRLILGDGTIHEFESDLTNINQTSTGKITLNSDTIVEDLSTVKPGEVTMNQLIIPYGKRSELTLADGTRIWLNSGSQISYPSIFTGKIREVYLSGEAFFDVAPDKAKPFIVNTGDLKMKVVGTSFDVCAYENDPTTQVVLVEGKILSGRNRTFAKPVELVPGERLVFKKSDETLIKDRVDVELYSSWVNGYLIFRNEPVSGIFRKLERYYNRQIVMENNLDKVTFSGKLDLIEDIEMVLDNISFTASFTVSRENNIYTIK